LRFIAGFPVRFIVHDAGGNVNFSRMKSGNFEKNGVKALRRLKKPVNRLAK